MQLDDKKLGAITRLLLENRDYHTSSLKQERTSIFEWIIGGCYNAGTGHSSRLIRDFSFSSKSPLEVADVGFAIALALPQDNFWSAIISTCFESAGNRRSASGLFLCGLEMANHSPLRDARETFARYWRDAMKTRRFGECMIEPSVSGRLSQGLGLYMQNIWDASQKSRFASMKDMVEEADTLDCISSPKSPVNFHEHLFLEVTSKLFLSAPASYRKTLLTKGWSSLRSKSK